MRLIDADALKKNLLDNAPTVEAIPTELHEKILDQTVGELLECQSNLRPQGEWITDDFHNTICNMCGGIRRDNRVEYIAFCNKCGAEMQKGGAE